MKLLISFIFSVLVVSAVGAQEADKVKNPKRTPEAEWLAQFDGEWKTAFNGVMRCRKIGNKWILNEISYQNGVFSVQTIGYDQNEKKFVGTWHDASTHFIWQYDGKLDDSGRKLILQAKGPDPKDAKKTRQYRDIYEFKSKDEIVLVSQILTDNQWKTFNTAKMARRTPDNTENGK